MNSNNLSTFTFAPGLDLRSITREGQPWFIARDICNALGLSVTGTNLDCVDAADKMRFNLSLPGSPPVCVNESGLYSLILDDHLLGSQVVPCGPS